MKGFLHDTWTSKLTDEWLTPPYLLRALGQFDLDPCAPIDRPWDTARHHFTVEDDGLAKPWFGRVFLNPPYGQQTPMWLSRMHQHGNGIALVFARTETRMFFRHVWSDADGIMFLRGRLAFFRPDGTPARNAGAPSCLIAYGKRNVRSLALSHLEGVLVTDRAVIGDPTIRSEACSAELEVHHEKA